MALLISSSKLIGWVGRQRLDDWRYVYAARIAHLVSKNTQPEREVISDHAQESIR